MLIEAGRVVRWPGPHPILVLRGDKLRRVRGVGTVPEEEGLARGVGFPDELGGLAPKHVLPVLVTRCSRVLQVGFYASILIETPPLGGRVSTIPVGPSCRYPSPCASYLFMYVPTSPVL